MAADGEKAKAQTPVFGSSSTFGGASGFGGFAAVEKQPAEHEEGAEEGTAGEGEEDCSAEFKPLVQLDEVERVSGEEAEDVLLDLKSKLYRFDNDSGEWKERGVGQTRLLKNKESQHIRLLMRQEKTLKIRANHLEAQEFKKQFEEAMAHNDKVLGAEGEGEEAGTAAEEKAAAKEKAAFAEEEEADLADKVGKVSVADEKAEAPTAPGTNGAQADSTKDAKD